MADLARMARHGCARHSVFRLLPWCTRGRSAKCAFRTGRALAGDHPLMGSARHRNGTAGELPTARTASAVGIGFVGVAFLIAGTRGILWSGADAFSVVLLLIAALSWAIGTVVSRALAPPASPVKAAGMELLVGGGILLAASAAAGELAQLSANGILARSLAALVYLIILGSVVGFSVYTWLLGVTTPNRIATYAYVNPIVAVLLGALFLGEPLTANTIVAATIILGSIAVTVWNNAREAARPETCHPAKKLRNCTARQR